MPGRGEVTHLTTEASRIAGRVETADRTDATTSCEGSGPVLFGAEPVRRDDTDPGDNGVPRHFARTRVSTMAVWKPPKPLPTLSTESIWCSRAVSGT